MMFARNEERGIQEESRLIVSTSNKLRDAKSNSDILTAL